MKKLLIIDADSLTYHPKEVETLDEAKNFIDIKIKKIVEATSISDMELYLTLGKDSFRYTIYPEYKGNRVGGTRPEFYYDLKEYLISEYGAKYDNNLEADDMVYDRYINNREEFLLCSIDKDLLYNIEGRHLNLYNLSFVETSSEEARKHHFKQIIIGDTTDNIKPVLNRFGEGRLNNLLEYYDDIDIEELAKYLCYKTGSNYNKRYRLIKMGSNCEDVDIDYGRMMELDDIIDFENITKLKSMDKINNSKQDRKLDYKIEIIKFGKYKGKSFKWILENDYSYFKWLNKDKIYDHIENKYL